MPCVPTPWQRNPDGSMSKAQVERNLGYGLLDLYDCDQRRKAGVDAWPKAAESLETP